MRDKALIALEYFINFHTKNIEDCQNSSFDGKLAVFAGEAYHALEIYQFSKRKILIHF